MSKSFAYEFVLPVPRERVWAFYSDPRNIERVASPALKLKLLRADMPLRQGARLEFRAGEGFISIRWETQVSVWDEAGGIFVDEMVDGPFQKFTQTHSFKDEDGGKSTRVREQLEVGEPNGFAGSMAMGYLTPERMEEAFHYLERVMKEKLVGA